MEAHYTLKLNVDITQFFQVGILINLHRLVRANVYLCMGRY